MPDYNYKEKIDEMYKVCQQQFKTKQSIVDHLVNNGHPANINNVNNILNDSLNSQIDIVRNNGIALVNQYERLNELFCDFYLENNNHNIIEIDKVVATREAERKDHWLLWRDKLGRWTLGVTAAVLMYSSFVYLSEKVDFIKVPVHDLVTAKTK